MMQDTMDGKKFVYQIAQGCRRIGHGVRAVADDEAVVVVVVLPDELCNF